jgi:hypothetical protein
MRQRISILLFFTIFSTQVGRAQSGEQLWVEYMLNYPFANIWNVEFAATLSTVLQDPRWYALDLQVTPEVALGKHIDLMGAVLVSRTYQNKSFSTLEVREMLGTRIHFTPDKRIQTRLLLRVEQRNLEDQETGEWDHSMRTRIRAEGIMPLNKPSMYAGDKLWYGILDAEAFIVMDQDVKVRFANRLRIRAGISYGLRLEFMYTLQESKNAIDGDINTTDNIFRFRVKQYLKKSKPSKAQGTGN